VERVPETAPKGAVFCNLFTDTETYVVSLSRLHKARKVP
jgi:hypothetical protein